MKIRNKLLIGLAICAAALSAAALAACAGEEHQHTFAEGWTSDATHHWHEATCEHTGEKDGYAEHTWDGGTVTTAATCTEAGEKTYTCTVCSATKTEVIAATGHSYAKEWSSDNTHHWHEATCEHTGEKDGYAEHTWNSGTVTTPATCTEAGEKTYTCTVCSATKTEPIAATGHSYAGEWSSDNTHHWHEATCEHEEEQDGYAEHTWNDGEITTAAECEKNGVKTYTCTTCDATKTETISATGHSWDDGEITTPATCLEPGVKTYTCTNEGCGETKTEPIEATGHTFSSEWTYDETYHWHEATCGHDVVSGRNEHFYEAGECRICGAPQPVTEGLTFNLINDGTEYEVGQSLINDTSVLIPETHNGLPVTRIGNYAFYDRPNLRSITIPDSVTSIGSSAFYACKNLTSVTLGNGVTTIDYGAFQRCYRLTSITLPATLTSIGKYGFLDCVNLVEIQNNSELPIVAGSSDYGFIANFALHVYKEGESRLTHTDDYYTFYHDGNVSYLQGYWGLETDLVLPSSFVTHDGTLINDYEINQYVFYGHEELTSIVIPNNVTSIGKRAFRYCDKLMNATIGDGVISIGDGAFNECQEMTHITIGSGVTTIGTDAFLNCYKLIEVHNKSALEITTGSEDYGRLGYYAKHIYTEGESWISVDEDGYRFFYNGEEAYLIDYVGLETDLVLPSSFVAYDGTTVNQYVVYQYSFYYLTKLTSVTIPSSVTSIEYRAFWNCIRINTVIMSNSVTFVNYGAFGGSNIKDVYYGGTQEEWNAIEFEVDTYELQDATIYYYSETQPTEAGNYWHYAADGVTPVKW